MSGLGTRFVVRVLGFPKMRCSLLGVSILKSHIGVYVCLLPTSGNFQILPSQSHDEVQVFTSIDGFTTPLKLQRVGEAPRTKKLQPNSNNENSNKGLGLTTKQRIDRNMNSFMIAKVSMTIIVVSVA